MGSFFGAELCDLIGLYELSKLEPFYNIKKIGLYRDDGLAIIERKNNQDRENNKNSQIHWFLNNNRYWWDYMKFYKCNVRPCKQ